MEFLRGEDVSRLEVSDHGCLYSIPRVGRNDRVNIASIESVVFVTGSENTLSLAIQLRRLRWVATC